MRPRTFDRLLQRFFTLLYTRLAWGYDVVAWLASMGQWQQWIRQADLGWREGRVLEIGPGPGHLLAGLAARRVRAIGLDPSPQMARIAARRLRRLGIESTIARGVSQALPFHSESFEGVVATFPGPFLFEDGTLLEIERVLQPGGRLVIIPLARITSSRIPDRLAACLQRITRQSEPADIDWSSWLTPYGFEAKQEEVTLPRAVVVRIEAIKPPSTLG